MSPAAGFADAFTLDGRVAIVTGAGSGIGAASARLLAAAGATVICADRSGSGAQATADVIGECEGTAGGAVACEVDVTDRAAVFELAAEVAAQHERLDVWCNIAGVIDLTDEQFDRVFDVNFRGALYGCQAALTAMIPAGQGSIINMCPGAIDTPAPTLGAYAVSKSALAQLTRTLAVEVGPAGIRVNGVAPGRQQAVEPRRAQSPLGLVGEPDDIAHTVLYLAGDAARFVTGQVLRANGGVAMPW